MFITFFLSWYGLLLSKVHLEKNILFQSYDVVIKSWKYMYSVKNIRNGGIFSYVMKWCNNYLIFRKHVFFFQSTPF